MQIGIYLLIFLIPFQIYFPIIRNLHISIAQTGAIAFYLLVVWMKFGIKDRAANKKNLIDWAILSLIIAMAVSIPMSSDIPHSVKCFVKWLSFISIYYSVSRTCENVVMVRRALLSFMIVAVCVSVFGLLEYFVGFPAIYDWIKHSSVMPIIINPNTLKSKLSTDSFNYVVHNWADMSKSGIRAFGTFECAIEFSAYLGLIIPLFPWFLRKEGKYKLLSFICVGIISSTLFLNFTRSAYLSFAIVGVMYMYYFLCMRKMTFRKDITVFLLAMMAGLVIGLFSSNIIRTLRHRIYQSISIEYTRPYLWKNATKIFISNPVLGVGIGNYQGGLDKYIRGSSTSLPAHNQYLQMAAETGTAGLVAYLAVLAVCIYYSVLILVKTADGELQLIALGFLGIWIWYCFQSFFDTYLFGDKFSMMFWLVVGLNASLYRIYLKEQNDAQILHKVIPSSHVD